MIEILEFIFGNFWRFIGTVILLETIFGGFRGIFARVNIKKSCKEEKGPTTLPPKPSNPSPTPRRLSNDR